MSKAAVKYRRPLNDKQLHLLKLIYKFRFVTTNLLLDYSGTTNHAVIHGRLKVLLDQEYIGKNYDSSYRLQNKHASYYLLPKGINILKAQGLDEAVLHSMYKDRSVSQRFVGHSLDVLQICTQLRKLYKDRFSIYTRSELGQYDQFPKPRPDLYISGDKDYILELLDSSIPFFAIKKMINRYISHEESGEWDGDYPTLLLVCGSVSQESRLLQYVDQVSESSDLQFKVTIFKALCMAQNKKDAIWSVQQDERPITLR